MSLIEIDLIALEPSPLDSSVLALQVMAEAFAATTVHVNTFFGMGHYSKRKSHLPALTIFFGDFYSIPNYTGAGAWCAYLTSFSMMDYDQSKWLDARRVLRRADMIFYSTYTLLESIQNFAKEKTGQIWDDRGDRHVVIGVSVELPQNMMELVYHSSLTVSERRGRKTSQAQNILIVDGVSTEVQQIRKEKLDAISVEVKGSAKDFMNRLDDESKAMGALLPWVLASAVQCFSDVDTLFGPGAIEMLNQKYPNDPPGMVSLRMTEVEAYLYSKYTGIAEVFAHAFIGNGEKAPNEGFVFEGKTISDDADPDDHPLHQFFYHYCDPVERAIELKETEFFAATYFRPGNAKITCPEICIAIAEKMDVVVVLPGACTLSGEAIYALAAGIPVIAPASAEVTELLQLGVKNLIPYPLKGEYWNPALSGSVNEVCASLRSMLNNGVPHTRTLKPFAQGENISLLFANNSFTLEGHPAHVLNYFLCAFPGLALTSVETGQRLQGVRFERGQAQQTDENIQEIKDSGFPPGDADSFVCASWARSISLYNYIAPLPNQLLTRVDTPWSDASRVFHPESQDPANLALTDPVIVDELTFLYKMVQEQIPCRDRKRCVIMGDMNGWKTTFVRDILQFEEITLFIETTAHLHLPWLQPLKERGVRVVVAPPQSGKDQIIEIHKAQLLLMSCNSYFSIGMTDDGNDVEETYPLSWLDALPVEGMAVFFDAGTPEMCTFIHDTLKVTPEATYRCLLTMQGVMAYRADGWHAPEAIASPIQRYKATIAAKRAPWAKSPETIIPDIDFWQIFQCLEPCLSETTEQLRLIYDTIAHSIQSESEGEYMVFTDSNGSIAAFIGLCLTRYESPNGAFKLTAVDWSGDDADMTAQATSRCAIRHSAIAHLFRNVNANASGRTAVTKRSSDDVSENIRIWMEALKPDASFSSTDVDLQQMTCDHTIASLWAGQGPSLRYIYIESCNTELAMIVFNNVYPSLYWDGIIIAPTLTMGDAIKPFPSANSIRAQIEGEPDKHSVMGEFISGMKTAMVSTIRDHQICDGVCAIDVVDPVTEELNPLQSLWGFGPNSTSFVKELDHYRIFTDDYLGKLFDQAMASARHNEALYKAAILDSSTLGGQVGTTETYCPIIIKKPSNVIHPIVIGPGSTLNELSWPRLRHQLAQLFFDHVVWGVYVNEVDTVKAFLPELQGTHEVLLVPMEDKGSELGNSGNLLTLVTNLFEDSLEVLTEDGDDTDSESVWGLIPLTEGVIVIDDGYVPSAHGFLWLDHFLDSSDPEVHRVGLASPINPLAGNSRLYAHPLYTQVPCPGVCAITTWLWERMSEAHHHTYTGPKAVEILYKDEPIMENLNEETNIRTGFYHFFKRIGESVEEHPSFATVAVSTLNNYGAIAVMPEQNLAKRYHAPFQEGHSQARELWESLFIDQAVAQHVACPYNFNLRELGDGPVWESIGTPTMTDGLMLAGYVFKTYEVIQTIGSMLSEGQIKANYIRNQFPAVYEALRHRIWPGVNMSKVRQLEQFWDAVQSYFFNVPGVPGWILHLLSTASISPAIAFPSQSLDPICQCRNSMVSYYLRVAISEWANNRADLSFDIEHKFEPYTGDRRKRGVILIDQMLTNNTMELSFPYALAGLSKDCDITVVSCYPLDVGDPHVSNILTHFMDAGCTIGNPYQDMNSERTNLAMLSRLTTFCHEQDFDFAIFPQMVGADLSVYPLAAHLKLARIHLFFAATSSVSIQPEPMTALLGSRFQTAFEEGHSRSEKLCVLEGSYDYIKIPPMIYRYMPPVMDGQVKDLLQGEVLPRIKEHVEKYFTLMYWGNVANLYQDILETWVRVLKEVPYAYDGRPTSLVLYLTPPDWRPLQQSEVREIKQTLAEIFRHHRIERDRVHVAITEISVSMPIKDQINVARKADIFLQTYCNDPHYAALPFLSGTPVVTLTGQDARARLTSDLLNYLGIHGTRANDLEGYVEIVHGLIQDGDRLNQVTKQMIQTLSPENLAAPRVSDFVMQTHEDAAASTFVDAILDWLDKFIKPQRPSTLKREA